MKKSGLTRWHIAFLAFFMAYFWLFPPNLFKDCIHAVFSAAQPDCASNCLRADGAPNCALTEEDYLDLFHLEKSEYKIAWKFFGND